MAVGAADNAEGWFMLSADITREAEEIAGATLFALGATGTVILDETERRIKIGAYFNSATAMDMVKAALEDALLGANVELDRIETEVSFVPNEDWLQKWKEGYEPVSVGKRFLIVPSWKLESVLQQRSEPRDEVGAGAALGGSTQGPNESDSNGRIIILIDPGMAFGTGTHETTRLCLELLERYWRGGTLLDVGTGTGILSIAAAKIAPGSTVTGIDIDPVAVGVARENAVTNGVPELDLRVAQPADLGDVSFDMVVANLTADLIIALMPELVSRLRPGGYLVLSGILSEQADEVHQAIRDFGPEIVERAGAGEWVAFAAKRN